MKNQLSRVSTLSKQLAKCVQTVSADEFSFTTGREPWQTTWDSNANEVIKLSFELKVVVLDLDEQTKSRIYADDLLAELQFLNEAVDDAKKVVYNENRNLTALERKLLQNDFGDFLEALHQTRKLASINRFQRCCQNGTKRLIKALIILAVGVATGAAAEGICTAVDEGHAQYSIALAVIAMSSLCSAVVEFYISGIVTFSCTKKSKSSKNVDQSQQLKLGEPASVTEANETEPLNSERS